MPEKSFIGGNSEVFGPWFFEGIRFYHGFWGPKKYRVVTKLPGVSDIEVRFVRKSPKFRASFKHKK